MMEVSLCEDDSLYIPPGFTVSYENPGDGTSLTMQIQVYSSVTVADMIEMILPVALATAKDLRDPKQLMHALPNGFLTYLGVARSENDGSDARRGEIAETLRTCCLSLVDRIVDHVDGAADQLAKRFLLERLPIPLSAREEELSVATYSPDDLRPFSQLRMLRPDIARAVVEDGKVVLYHCMDNSRQRWGNHPLDLTSGIGASRISKEMFGSPMSNVEFELDDGPAIEALLDAYPDPVQICDLPHVSEDVDDKVDIARAVFREGLLLVFDPLSG
eukprot:gene30844-39728_t